jgi:HEAT repeat protein
MKYFFCTRCWSEISAATTVCPQCHDDVAARKTRGDYADALIAALQNPDPVVTARAAWLLGERRKPRGVLGLCRLVRESTDAFAVESALDALTKIGDSRATATVRWAVNHVNPLVRASAARVVAQAIFREKP